MLFERYIDDIIPYVSLPERYCIGSWLPETNGYKPTNELEGCPDNF